MNFQGNGNLHRRLRRFRKQAQRHTRDLMVFFQPVTAGKRAQHPLAQVAMGVATVLSLLLLSGISIAAMATLTVSLLAIWLILDRILGIEIQSFMPPINAFS